MCMFVYGKGEVISVFILRKQYNLLRSECENITDQTKITDNRNAYVTMNSSSNEMFLRYIHIANSPYGIGKDKSNSILDLFL